MMLHYETRNARRGFTLLEVLLASAIAVLLLGALYVAFDVTLKQTDAGRGAVHQSDVVRGIANRISIDLTCCIGPMQPKSGGGIPEDTASANGTTASSPTTSGTTNATGTSGQSSTEVAAGVAAGTTDLSLSEGVIAADLPFQGGLFGSDKQVTLFVSRVPPALANPETADPFSGGVVDQRSDLRRVTYYMGTHGGLCRQEKPWVTADGVRNSADPDRADEASDTISDEVIDITFTYYDGTAWVSSWTGSDPTTDGKSVKGPPRAIKITMTIQPPGTTTTKIISHVIPIRAAVGLYQPPVPEEEVVPDATTTGM
jgi:prepilin-type N-terminal cleavage/methylation domain-containing protein